MAKRAGAASSGLLGLIGLGYRARNVVVGTDAVRKELQAGRCRCVVLAADASARAVDKVVRLAAARRVPVLTGPGAAAIGAQLGKPPVMAVGVRDRALAGGMVQLAPARIYGGLSGQDESSRSRRGVRRTT